jgi:hypothetical protein
MRLLIGILVSIAVFVFVGVVGWVDFYSVNDSLLLGTIVAAGTYWAVSLVATIIAGILGAFVGAISGAILGVALDGESEEIDSISGCGSKVVLVCAAFVTDIYVLVHLHEFIAAFPEITLGVAIFISLMTSIMSMLFNYKKR